MIDRFEQLVRKTYVGLFARERAHDEFVALEFCRRNGLRAPTVIAANFRSEAPHLEMSLLGSRALTGMVASNPPEYARRVLLFLVELHRRSPKLVPGFGWLASWQDAWSDGAEFGLELVKRPLQQLGSLRPNWVAMLREVLSNRPVVYLHRDLKPDHIFLEEGSPTVSDGQIGLIDWEYASRGPDLLDLGDLCWRFACDMSGAMEGLAALESLEEVAALACSLANSASDEEMAAAYVMSSLNWADHRTTSEMRLAISLVDRLVSGPRRNQLRDVFSLTLTAE